MNYPLASGFLDRYVVSVDASGNASNGKVTVTDRTVLFLMRGLASLMRGRPGK